MNIRKYNNKLEKLKEAYVKLIEIQNEKSITSYYEDALIQRFEFTFELLWKTIKEALESNGFIVNSSPKEVLKEAFKVGYIKDLEIFIEMINDRNLMSQTYDNILSNKIANNIKDKYIKLIGKTINDIEEI